MKKSIKIFVIPFILVLAFSLSSETFAQRNQRHSKPHKSNHRVYKSSHHNHGHTKHRPKYGTYVSHVHHNAVVLRNGSTHYRYHEGVYYKPYKGRYIVSHPCTGLRIGVLPIGYRTVVVRNVPYYYYEGVYYRGIHHGGYEVINPPVGAVVEYLPEGARTVFIDDNEYYVVNQVYYKPVVIEGYLMYEVVG